MSSKIFGCAIIAVIFGSLIVTGVPVDSTTTLSVNTTKTADNGTHQELEKSLTVTGLPENSKTRTVSVNTTRTADNGSHQEYGSNTKVTGLADNSKTTILSVNTTHLAGHGGHQELERRSIVTGLPDNSTSTTTHTVNTTHSAEHGTHQEFGSSKTVTGLSDQSKRSVDTTGLPANSTTTSVSVNTTKTAENGTHQELYIVKVSTYEVGILANVSDDETENDYNEHDVHQQVDLSFFDTESNGTHINLGDIPFPVQTNVSGEIITGVAPVHIGAVTSIGEALSVLPFSGTIVNITNSDTSYVTVTRDNITELEQQTVLKDDSDLSKLPILNNVLLPDSFNEAVDDVKDAEKDQKEELKKP